jgi:peroxiredoxin
MTTMVRLGVCAALMALATGGALGCGGATPGASGPNGAATSGGDAAGAPAGDAKKSSGAKAPDFTLPGLKGGSVSLSDYLGKNVVLLDFWSTTCDPCMVEMPHLVAMYEKYKDKGFVVLAISLDGPESLSQVQSIVHDKRMSFPVLLDQETKVIARYNPKRDMPFAVLIDKSGAIVDKRAGYTAGDETSLEAKVQALLQ